MARGWSLFLCANNGSASNCRRPRQRPDKLVQLAARTARQLNFPSCPQNIEFHSHVASATINEVPDAAQQLLFVWQGSYINIIAWDKHCFSNYIITLYFVQCDQ